VNHWKGRLDQLLTAEDVLMGTSAWVPVTRAESDIFERVTLGPFDLGIRGGGRRRRPVPGLFLLAVLSKFGSEVGLPVETSEHVTVLNYGYDDVRWLAPVTGGALIRAQVLLRDVVQKREGQYLLRQRFTLFSSENDGPVLTATNLILAVLLDPAK
jgi:hypothetical protein